MKKSLFLLLCLLLVLGTLSSLAEPAPDLSDSAQVIEPFAPGVAQLNPQMVRSVFPETQDKLVLGEDGVYQLTSKGVTLHIQPPFGVLFFTQDMQAQIEDYLLLNNARGMAEYLIEKDYAGMFLDPTTGMELLLLFRENSLSRLFVNSQENFPLFFMTVQDILLDNQTASQVDMNGTSYVHITEEADGGAYHLYYAVKNGIRVALQGFAEEWTPELEQYLISALEGMTFTE